MYPDNMVPSLLPEDSVDDRPEEECVTRLVLRVPSV